MVRKNKKWVQMYTIQLTDKKEEHTSDLYSPVLDQWGISVSIRKPKVKQHRRGVFCDWSVKAERMGRRTAFVYLCHSRVFDIAHRYIKAGEPSSQWRIKIDMHCLRITFRRDSQILGNRPLFSSSPMLKPYSNNEFLY